MMKRLLVFISMTAVLSLILAACSGLGPGAAGQDATEPPTGAPATEPPTIVPIDLAGPEMRVGSFYTYVDGAILAAVPDDGPVKIGFNNFFDAKEHTVTISDFWIYTSEVTNHQFEHCVTIGKCTPPDPADNPEFQNYRLASFPVVGVNYQQAADYCAFVHGRLPTEAEWEKAARGPESNPFPWGDAAPSCDRLNFDFCKGKPITVKSYADGVSFYKLFDMSGNVREWAADWYGPYLLDSSQIDPLGGEIGQKRVVRSSSFADSADFAFAAHRFSLKPIDHLPDLGFRCVVLDPTFYAPYCVYSMLFGSDGNGNATDQVVKTSGDCIQPGINPDPDCKLQVTRLEVVPPGLPSDYDITLNDPSGACTDNGPQKYVCDGKLPENAGSLTVTPGECKVAEDVTEGQCPPGSSEQVVDGQKVCTGRGPGENCPDGSQYDAALQCCSVENSTGSGSTDCPPGFTKLNDVCVSDQTTTPPHDVSQDFGPVTYCPPHEGGGDDSSSCPPVTCPYGQSQQPDCSCK